jgi:hypothetical protein
VTKRKMIACDSCKGEKRCTSCGGSGLVERVGVRMPCAVCSGSGRCLKCGGTGEVEGGGEPSIGAG